MEPIISVVKRILNGTIKSGKYFFNLDWLNIDQVQFKNHLTVFYYLSLSLNYKYSRVKWSTSSRCPSSLYCPMRNSDDKMTIEKTHLSLIHVDLFVIFTFVNVVLFSIVNHCSGDFSPAIIDGGNQNRTFVVFYGFLSGNFIVSSFRFERKYSYTFKTR